MSSAPLPSSQAFVTHDEIPPAVRKRLEQLRQYGVDKEKIGDFDYAHSMYAQCVAKDPSNLGYVESMMGNLAKKYEGKKKKCRVRSNRGPFKKALSSENWRKALKLGTDLLAENPWDTATLRGMAEACAALHFNEVELRYLKNALDGNSKDIDVNRHCATSLARMGQFDQAIACWHRIEDKAKVEALKAISDLTVAKTQRAIGYVDGKMIFADSQPSFASTAAAETRPTSGTASASDSAKSGGKQGVESRGKSPARPLQAEVAVEAPLTVDSLEEAISRSPEDVSNYLRLAELHDHQGHWKEAEQVLRRVLPISGGDFTVRELLEKAQLRRSKAYLLAAEKQAESSPNDATREQLQRIRKQHNRLELEIYSARAERYPDDLALQYEVGVRLKRAGSFAEAVTYFEASEADARCAGPASLARGECLQQMRQYAAALKSYDASAAASHGESQKLALYRAGVLATGLKDIARARKYLEKLVEIDRGYRDAALRLDKLG